MLTPPALATETISACLRESYGLRVRQVTFLPLGADVNAAVYRVEAQDGAAYFLKLRRGNFDEIAVAVPAFLRAHGAQRVMAPLPATEGRLWVSGHGFVWILYPFMEGKNGYEVALSDAQWVALGESLRAIHSAVLPAEISQRVPREAYSPRWRDIVTQFDQQVETRVYDDPVAERLAAFWRANRSEIRLIVERASALGETLRRQAAPFVICHSDLHAGNLLLGADGAMAIVDWDDPIFAPKERDLMFVGSNLSGVWDDAREVALFYQGYGATTLDPVALSYYRYERIVADLAAYGEQIFGAQGSLEDREVGLRQMTGQFLPHEDIAIAHRAYQRLS